MSRKTDYKPGQNDAVDLEKRELPASMVTIGATAKARVELEKYLGDDWVTKIENTLDNIDIKGVIDVEFDPVANNSYGYIDVGFPSIPQAVGSAAGSAGRGGYVIVDAARIASFGIEIERVILHEVIHLIQPPNKPRSGHTLEQNSIMYSFAIPKNAYGFYGIDPKNPFKLTESDFATYRDFWENHSPFVMTEMESPAQIRSGEAAEVRIKVRPFAVGLSSSSVTLNYPGGTMRFPISELKGNTEWTKTVSVPVTATGRISMTVEGATPATGWSSRQIVVSQTDPIPPVTGPTPNHPEPPKPPSPPALPAFVSVGITGPSSSNVGINSTYGVNVRVGSGTLTGGVLVVNIVDSSRKVVRTERVPIPETPRGRTWTHTVQQAGLPGRWSIEAKVENAQPGNGNSGIKWIHSFRPAQIARPRVWTARHEAELAKVIRELKNVPIWKNATLKDFSNEVHRRLGT